MRVATDIGGTFTDMVYVDGNGQIEVAKGPTTPPDFERGVISILESNNINLEAMSTFIHGTTVIINALTERKGAKTGLITTEGFRDVLEIARGNRPDLFNIRYKKPEPFVERNLRREVEERIDYKGNVITPLNEDHIRQIVNYFKREGVEAIAVAYLHSYVNPEHERRTVELIKELWPEISVSASHNITKEWREYERTNTVALNSYVQPTATSYVNRLDNKLKDASGQKFIMQSNGGTTTFEEAKKVPINMVESGPVAGIYGAAVLGSLIGEENIIAFDIGGTTAKCSLIEKGEVKVSTDYYIERNERNAGYPIKTPVVDIEEIGNGGGSIAWLDEGGALKVGPESAGAVPGPISYGQGGMEPTTTDAHLITGRLSAENFDYDVDMQFVRDTIQTKIADHFNMTAEEAALGIIRIANSNMLNTLKLISIRKGYNPQNFTLVAFGGGGSMHAPALAKELGVKKVVIPVASPVFSAWGMLMTDLRHDYIKTFIKRLGDLTQEEIKEQWQQIDNEAYQQFGHEGIRQEDILFNRYIDMRYLGQEHTVKVPVSDGDWGQEHLQEIAETFHQLHEQNYTFRLDDTETEIVNLHVTAFGKVEKPDFKKRETNTILKDAKLETRNVYFENSKGWVQTDVYQRDLLPSNTEVKGPAIIEEKASSTVLYHGQKFQMDDYGNIIIETEV